MCIGATVTADVPHVVYCEETLALIERIHPRYAEVLRRTIRKE
jgi:hypothetical protein